VTNCQVVLLSLDALRSVCAFLGCTVRQSEWLIGWVADRLNLPLKQHSTDLPAGWPSLMQNHTKRLNAVVLIRLYECKCERSVVRLYYQNSNLLTSLTDWSSKYTSSLYQLVSWFTIITLMQVHHWHFTHCEVQWDKFLRNNGCQSWCVTKYRMDCRRNTEQNKRTVFKLLTACFLIK
jgi:hypothetical protein